MRVLTTSIFNNRPIKFKSVHRDNIELSDKSNIGYYNHTSSFFRCRQMDEFVTNKIRVDAKNNPVEIISAGCSYGEEPYSYAMLLNEVADNVRIFGVDVSSAALEGARSGKYIISGAESELFFGHGILSNFERICRKLFFENFEPVPRSRYKHEYKKKNECLSNCEFHQMDIENLSDKFSPNSADVLLCRFVLYHFYDGLGKKGVLDKVIQQIYDILKPGGLLVIEDDRHSKMIIDKGFENINEKYPGVYRKLTVS